jgi:hypothetical protein
MPQPTDISLEHIDPRKHPLVSGLTNDLNEIFASVSYNAHKNNWFVPYRVHDYPAPVTFGDIGEFLIQDFWCVVEFGGEWWMNEARRIMSILSPRRHAKSQQQWESEIAAKETELGIHVIVCSPNGLISHKQRCSISCSHGTRDIQLNQMGALSCCCRKGRDYSYISELVTCPDCGKTGAALPMSQHFAACILRAPPELVTLPVENELVTLPVGTDHKLAQ